MVDTVRIKQKDRLFQIAILIVIAFGLLLRAAKYLPAFSMRGDELAVTLNLINRSAIELTTKPLEHEQAAPFGFVLLTKGLITMLGQSEYVLRLAAFAAGCFSLLLMYRLLTTTTGRYGTLFALAAFAVGNYPVYYSAELKPYSTDVLWTLVLLLAFHRHVSRETTARDFVILAALGALSLCFSYAAIFVVAALGMTLFLHYWKDKRKLLWITLTGITWAGIFLVLYFALLQHQTQSTYLITYWDNLLSFMPMPPWRDISWFPKALAGLFFVVAGLGSSLILVSAIYAFGLGGLLKERNWRWILVLTIPVGLNIVVSGFQKYPFHGRLILYLLPLVFIVLAKGIDLLVSLIRRRAFANVVFIGLLILLLKPAVPTTSSYLLTHSYLREDLKPVFSFMEANHHESDLVYIYHLAGAPYFYYAPRYDLDNLSYILGQNNSASPEIYHDELSALPRGQRIWFVFSFVIEARISRREKQNEREYILHFLKENGTLLDEFYSRNSVSSAHLFILR